MEQDSDLDILNLSVTQIMTVMIVMMLVMIRRLVGVTMMMVKKLGWW